MKSDDSNTRSKVLRILIADDYPHAAESLARRLRREGFEVEVALDGRQAIQAADRFRPDLALLDLTMPDLNGYEVAEWLRKQPWAEDILLVALSGHGQQEDLERTRAAGFDTHLVKPVDHARLVELFSRFRSEKKL